ncbi:MAG: M3 family metallopeptidase [Thermoanaerobaculia bacterium]
MSNRELSIQTRFFASALLTLAVMGTTLPARTDMPAADPPFWTGMKDAATFEKAMDARLETARTIVAWVRKPMKGRNVENTLRRYDDAMFEIDTVASQAQLVQNVHPKKDVRETAEKISQKASALFTELSLDSVLYVAIKGVDVSAADAETSYYVKRLLRDFRLAGVDQDEPARRRIKALNDQLVLIGQEFQRNISTDSRKVSASPAELDGLPADFIAQHMPGADGRVTLTIESPDSGPVMAFAKSGDLRKRMFLETANRGYPKNLDVLDKLIARRAALAKLLGFATWADAITADKMVQTSKRASDFIDQIAEASEPKATREYAQILARKKQDYPQATSIDAWERSYYAELVRKASFDFDAQSVRPYFPFDRVKQGLFDVTSRLFDVTIRPLPNVPVWDPSVEAFELLEGGRVIARFYLDMHPRADKYNHAAEFPVRTGVAGRHVPEAALVCNLPGGKAGDPGLMEQNDVSTFFHEFGHLVHTLLAGQHRWYGIGGITTEQDFVEAPSQMLEEWTRDAKTLALFARHHETNEPIPAALVAKMRRANEFGKAIGIRQQMVYAKLSLSIYDRDPKLVDTSAMVKELTNRYLQTKYVEGTHFQTSFGHLNGYSAIYYTYMWSLVIAKDMFSRFDTADLLKTDVAKRYRDTVLAPGGSKPADQLVQDFLGRPFNTTAWRAWLDREE